MLFGFGGRLSRVSGYLIRMANAIKPIFFRYPDGKRNQTKVFCVNPDGKRNKTNVFLFIRIANAIKPMFFCVSGSNTLRTYVLCLSGLIPMANAIKHDFVLHIRMANAIKPMQLFAYLGLFRWQTQ